ncbi:hypothetical protein G7046_g10074 [Stylonectria norvegica]|nr:hypothetical protein G7046_g10074 [Stylonectria norvegica]
MTDRNAAAMDKTGKAGERGNAAEEAKGTDREHDRDRDVAIGDAIAMHKSPKKRRKVNHGTQHQVPSNSKGPLGSERPCTRCIKRNIGHLCHDEPRDADSKKAKSVQSIQSSSVVDESDAQSDMARSSISSTMGPPPNYDGTGRRPNKAGFGAGGVLGQASPLSLVQPGPVSGGLQGNTLNNSNSNANQCTSCEFSVLSPTRRLLLFRNLLPLPSPSPAEPSRGGGDRDSSYVLRY